MAGDGDDKVADPASHEGTDAPPVFEQLLADILTNEGAKAHADLAHGFAAFYLTTVADGVEAGAAVMLTGQWMQTLLAHRRAIDTEEAD